MRLCWHILQRLLSRYRSGRQHALELRLATDEISEPTMSRIARRTGENYQDKSAEYRRTQVTLTHVKCENVREIRSSHNTVERVGLVGCIKDAVTHAKKYDPEDFVRHESDPRSAAYRLE